MTTSMRIEASYAALTDSKGRSVSGYAIITEELRGTEPPSFVVKTYATRDAKQFGASFPRGTHYATRDAAIAGAHKALAAQGRRYAKTFGGAA
jgi:hypothetical protein